MKEAAKQKLSLMRWEITLPPKNKKLFAQNIQGINLILAILVKCGSVISIDGSEPILEF